jgi:hypothetical protein
VCTLVDVPYVPKNMTPEELRQGLYWLTERLDRAGCLERRRGPFCEGLGRQPDDAERALVEEGVAVA